MVVLRQICGASFMQVRISNIQRQIITFGYFIFVASPQEFWLSKLSLKSGHWNDYPLEWQIKVITTMMFYTLLAKNSYKYLSEWRWFGLIFLNLVCMVQVIVYTRDSLTWPNIWTLYWTQYSYHRRWLGSELRALFCGSAGALSFKLRFILVMGLKPEWMHNSLCSFPACM